MSGLARRALAQLDRYRKAPRESFEDLRLMPGILFWMLVFRLRKRRTSVADMVRMASADVAAHPDAGRWQRIGRLTRWAGELLLQADSDCLEKALVNFRFLRLAGANPQLVVGMQLSASGWKGHAWVELEATPFGESYGSRQDYKAVGRFGGVAASPASRAAG